MYLLSFDWWMQIFGVVIGGKPMAKSTMQDVYKGVTLIQIS